MGWGNEEHIAVVKKGAKAIAAWREEHVGETLNLSHADLSGICLDGADLGRAKLWQADLHNATLKGANLKSADLGGTDLSGANLSRANLNKARLGLGNFIKANFMYANLAGVRFFRSDLSAARLAYSHLEFSEFIDTTVLDTIFSRASLELTLFSGIDFSTAIGLDSLRHVGPSCIDIRTLLASRGKIPPVFLRGCGYDPLIQQVLVGEGASQCDAFNEWFARGPGVMHYQSCFISYGTEDKIFVNRLQKALNEAGVVYWYAPAHIRGGARIDQQLTREIHLKDRVILICSKDSLSSDWVRFEIAETLKREDQTGKTVLFPVMIDDSFLTWTGPKAERIREIQAGDFRGKTKGAAFQAAVRRLLEDIEVRTHQPPPT